MKFYNTFKRCLPALTLLAVWIEGAEAKLDLSQIEALQREQSLIAAATTTDSIKILLDVYNLSDRPYRNKVRKQLINLASKSNNKEVIGDVVKELATTTDDTRELKRLIEISENMPEDEGRDHIQTVLKMEEAQAEASTIVDSQLKEQLADTRRQALIISGDPYKEIQNIYRTMVYLGANSQGPMYFQYINRLGDLVENLPEEDHAIRNLYYTNAALYFTRARDYEKAIEYDRKLINQLDAIRQHYEDAGKNTDELDYFYYVSYRRMLRNFRGLDLDSVEEYYKRSVELAEKNDDAREEFGNGGLTNSYYYFATGQYGKAVPELKKALRVPGISDFRKQELLGLLAYALDMTGDKKGELEALQQYVLLSIEDRNKRREDMYREIELRNSVDRVLSDERAQEEQQRKENRVMRKTSITLVYVLGVILIFVCGAYFRLRGRVRELEIRNNRLHRNIEYIFDDGVPKGTRDLRHQKNRLKG